MTKTKKEQLTLKVHQVFQLLLQHPTGLPTKDLWAELERLSHLEQNGNGNGNHGPSFDELSFFCVGPIKAGWLAVERNNWTISDAGKSAFETYRDPQQLMNAAAKQSTQGWLATQFPRAYSSAGKAKDQLTSEVRTIRRVGVSRLFKETLGKPGRWQDVLPVQSPRTIEIPGNNLVSNDDLIKHLDEAGANYSEGSHAIYLSPAALRLTAFKAIAADYPADAGLKITKNAGGVDDSSYLMGRAKGDSAIQLGMVHSHRHLSMVANLLHAKGVGPRLYDLINLRLGDQIRTAYVVRDVGSSAPTVSQCEQGIQKLRQLDEQGVIKVILPDGFEDPEFECPSCCNNVLVDRDGAFQYIDFQNFLLGDYEKFLTDLAVAAAEQTHFGDTSALRGGRYLYQTVPGLKLPAKRDVANRMKTLSALLAEAGVSVAERLVLDVGCNIGMMMSQYLKLGAKWCHGWDRAATVVHTEQLLLALGCTRFSTTGTDITSSRALQKDLPPHAAGSLDGCVISYLAVRGHLDWLDCLGQIPWSFMIYEGHEGETVQDFETYLAEFSNLANFKLGPTSTYIDGDSEERMVAILLRNN